MNSHKTAISRNKISKPMAMFDDMGLLIGRVLDFGCGKGKDCEVLKIEGYDPHFFPTEPKGKFDVVTMNYVINTISDHRGRMDAILGAWNYLNRGGLLIVSARKVVDIHKEAHKEPVWKRTNDGYMTTKGTFQKGFTSDEIAGLLNNLFNGIVAVSPITANVSFAHALAVKLSI